MSNQRSSESNSILSYITPWIGRVLIIVIIIVIIVAVIKLMGGAAFGPLNDILGFFGALAKSLEGQLQACGLEGPDSTTCNKTTDCVNSTCVDGNCQQCKKDQDCKPLGDNYTCQSNKMCKPPGGFIGLFNSGCIIGIGASAFLALFILVPILKFAFGKFGKSKLASTVEAITGKDAMDGVPLDEITEKAKKVSKKATEDELEKRQKNAREGSEGEKLPYEEDGQWYSENGSPMEANEAEARISKFKTTYETSLRQKVIRASLERNITKNGLSKAQNIEELNKVRTAHEEAREKTIKEADDEAAEDSDAANGDAVEEATNEVIPDPIG